MVRSLIDVEQARQTKEEVLIQDLLSGPVVGYTYDNDVPVESGIPAGFFPDNNSVNKDSIDFNSSSNANEVAFMSEKLSKFQINGTLCAEPTEIRTCEGVIINHKVSNAAKRRIAPGSASYAFVAKVWRLCGHCGTLFFKDWYPIFNRNKTIFPP